MRERYQKVLTLATPNFTHLNFINTVFDKMLSSSDIHVSYPVTDFGHAVEHWADQRGMESSAMTQITKNLRTIDLSTAQEILDEVDPDVIALFMQHLGNPQGALFIKTFIAQARKRGIPVLRAVPDRKDGSLKLDFIARA